MKKLLSISIFMAMILWTGCQKDDSKPSDQPTEGKFSTGSFIQITDVEIGEGGGVIEWNNTIGSFGGLSIEVPNGAFNRAVRHRLSYADIEKSSFNSLIDPISPLIHIENDEVFSERPILITLKVSVAETDIVGAFYYEEDPGELHGIPIVSRSADEVQIKVWHFSTIVLSKVQRSTIEKVNAFSIPFDLKENYWGFGNILTHLGDGGMCTGMSLGAMYLYGKEEVSDGFDHAFDNNPKLFQTPDIPDDDALGIKFASMLQKRYSNFMQFTYNREYQEPSPAFWSTAYYLYYKKRPMIMILSGPDQGDHAVIAIGYTATDSENGTIRIVDPNFYPSTFRELTLKNNAFEKYYSALNLADLKAGISYEFNVFNLFPFYKFKFKEVTDIWGLAKSGLASEDYYTYPEIEYFAHDYDDPDRTKIALKDLLTGEENFLPFKNVYFSASGKKEALDIQLFSYSGKESGKLDYDDPLNKSFDLSTGKLFIGLGAWTGHKPDYKQRKWADFKWFVTGFSDIEIISDQPGGAPILTPGITGNTYQFRVKEPNNLPENAKYTWHFSDDNSERITPVGAVTHLYTVVGKHTISLEVKTNAGVLIGKGSVLVSLEEPYIEHYNLSISDDGDLVYGGNAFIGVEYQIWAKKSKRILNPSVNLKYVWDFGDGTTKEVINQDTVKKIYYTKADKKIKCTLYDIDSGKKVAEDSSYSIPKLISIPDDVLPITINSFNFALLGSFSYTRDNYAIQVFRYYPSPENVEVQIDRSGFRYTSWGLVLEGSFNEYMTVMDHVKLVVDRSDSGKKVYETFEAFNVPFLGSNNYLNELSYGLKSPIDENAHNITVEHRHYESVIDEWIEITGVDWPTALFSLKLN